MLLSLTELVRLNIWGMRPEMVAKLIELEYKSDTQLGVKLAVREYGGYRWPGIQAQLVAWRNEADKADGIIGGGRDYYAVAPAGDSHHEYGAAADVGIVDPAQRTEANYRRVADLSRSIGLNPGYYFPKRDEFHHQLPESLSVARARWKSMMQGRAVIGATMLLAVGLTAWSLKNA